MSLFSILSRKVYKSKMRNIMTELCYKYDLQLLKNDKVLIKQTKNQSTYSCAGQKLTTLFSIHSNWSCFVLTFYFSTRLPPAILRPLQVKFENWMNTSPKCKVFIQPFPLFNSLWGNGTFLGQWHTFRSVTHFWVSDTLLGHWHIFRALAHFQGTSTFLGH